MKITIAGGGYVGLSLATLLSVKNEVTLLDIVPDKVDMINSRKSPIRDQEIEDFFREKTLNLHATTEWPEALMGAEFVIVATPTNYDDERDFFDTSAVEDILGKIFSLKERDPNYDPAVVIKSTIPVGFVERARAKFGLNKLFFSPEFLREGRALYDNLYPSRIIVGADSESAHQFADLLRDSAAKENIPTLFMGATEAEAVKLFANTYLALRIAFFNELDTYAEKEGLDARAIIDGVCLDPRVGDHYNNPSFGYGGYCLPKDTKQLRANYGEKIPQALISAVIESNIYRKKFIAEEVLKTQPSTVGIYRLTMKSGSDNFRSSAIQDIIKILQDHQVGIIIFEPTLNGTEFNGLVLENDLNAFKARADIILANRTATDLADVADKVYSRDLFSRD